MRLVRQLRGRVMAAKVGREAAACASRLADRHGQWQLAAFNREWQRISKCVPYWAALKAARGLPEQFTSFEQLGGTVPVLERSDLQARVHELCDPGRTPYRWRATGGSTGQPVRIPISRSEIRLAAVDMWHARSWFGLSAADKVFLIWGHSHLLGHGLAGFLRGQVRAGKDWLLGYRRWSAYCIGEMDLREAALHLLDFRPAYVLGYAVALDHFARVNEDRAPQLQALGLKAVIATGESFPRPESRKLVEEVFGCPVVMEYGAVETGPIAHEVPGGSYRVFWRHFAELIPSAVVPGSWELVLTSLHPRCLPLIRYRIGDLVVPMSETTQGPLLEFRAVLGRCNDTIVLPQGRRVHSEAMAHILRDAPVTGFQLVQRSEQDLTLRYTSGAALTETQTSDLRRRLGRVAGDLAAIRLERVAMLQQTVAGKTKAVCHVG